MAAPSHDRNNIHAAVAAGGQVGSLLRPDVRVVYDDEMFLFFFTGNISLIEFRRKG